MALYVNTLHIVTTREEADAFNAEHNDVSELYAADYAIAYGVIPHGCRFENIIIDYRGQRNSRYENELSQFQRKDIRRGFDN